MPGTARTAGAVTMILLLTGVLIAAGNTPEKPGNSNTSAPVNVKTDLKGGTDEPSIPQMINYQGILTDASGNPITGTRNITFTIYSELLGTVPWWFETQNNVLVTNGLFNVLMGSINPLRSVPERGDCFLEITVEGVRIAPRIRLASVPYAFNAAGLTSSLEGICRANVGSDLQGDNCITHVNLGTKSKAGDWHYNDSFNTISGGLDNVAYGPDEHGFATVGGGRNNAAEYDYATVSGGEDNSASDQYCTVSGGRDNAAEHDYATVSGGESNQASAKHGTVGGGSRNAVSGECSFVGGGSSNVACSASAAVGGGYDNRAAGRCAAIGGGATNHTSGFAATIGGGGLNYTGNYCATVGGGRGDSAVGDRSTVGGGGGNVACSAYAAIGGGQENRASGEHSTISGGYRNRARDIDATVGGGSGNDASQPGATIGGGQDNMGYGYLSTVGGGGYNVAEAEAATVGGGESNHASYRYATAGGGSHNDAADTSATVSGGYGNYASEPCATVGGGANNRSTGRLSFVGGGGDDMITANGNVAAGQWSTVAGGWNNTATGECATIPGGRTDTAAGVCSFAAGRGAQALHDGSFVWGDYNSGAVQSSAANEWRVRASGGVWFYTNSGLTTGAYMSASQNGWTNICDRRNKENFTPIDKRALLERLARMQLTEYNVKGQNPGYRHIGPVAQDFYDAFGYGETNLGINSVDADGVALAAIQALYGELQTARSQNQELVKRIESLEAKLAESRR